MNASVKFGRQTAEASVEIRTGLNDRQTDRQTDWWYP
jgi:hypothetical protein